MKINTLGEHLHWSYANLAMAHAAVSAKSNKYKPIHFIIRARLYAGLKQQTMNIGSLANDERLKMIVSQACCYCGSKESLTVDHLIAQKRGGADSGDNLVWACRSCNSSKGARDMLEWLSVQMPFPPLLLLRRYLKLVIEISVRKNLMQTPLDNLPENLAFSVTAIPKVYPPPNQLRLWVAEIGSPAQDEGFN